MTGNKNKHIFHYGRVWELLDMPCYEVQCPLRVYIT